MKKLKICLATIGLAGLMGTAQAQDKGFDLGVKAGLNYGTLPSNLTELKDKSGKMGYNLGVFARAGKQVYLQPEVNFSTFASEYTFNLQNYKPKFQQLNVPVMLGYKLINTSALKFRLAVGPEFNLNLNTPEAPASLNYKDFQTGALVNAGIDLGNLTIDARYSRGISKINTGLKEQTNLFNLSVGFKIF